jgi:3-hydroxyacyl-CoA dehydrogenase
MERQGSIGIHRIDAPPVNALTRAEAGKLASVIFEFERDASLTALVVTGTGKVFIAGADIREIERITKGEQPPDMSYLNEVLHAIENCAKPIVMAMQGIALGIGLETAMAGHYRILAAKASVGLPEVKLGLIPGAGGTQRLPRLVGVDAALRLMITGQPIAAEEALALGIVDEVCDGDVVQRAVDVAAVGVGIRRTRDLTVGKDRDWAAASRLCDACWPEHEAPLSVIAALRDVDDFDRGMEREAEVFRQRLVSAEARALVYLFFAERAAKDVVVAGHPAGERMRDAGFRAEVGAELLREGAVKSAEELDVICVRGFGYPARLGGPCYQSLLNRPQPNIARGA